jgi:hypothetical protein
MPSISLPTAVVGAGVLGLGGSALQAGAANNASSQQATAARNALATQVAAENTGLAAEAPYETVGLGAEDQLANLYGIAYGASGTGAATVSPTGVVTPGNIYSAISSPGGPQVQAAADQAFTQSPDYQFAFQQGLQALDRSAAAGTTPGLSVGGGGAAIGAEQYGQGLASQQFGNYFSRLQSLAGMGQSAASGVANLSANAGNSQGNTQQAIGQAQASGTVGSASALSGGLSSLGSGLTSSLLVNKLGLGGNTNLASAYQNSTGNYGGLSDAGQDAIQDNPDTSYLLN